MTRNFCKELEIGTKKHFVETTSLRLDLGFFVNLAGFLLIFSLFAKDENVEKHGDFVFFGVVLLYNVLFSTFVRLMYFRTFSKINEENIHKYCNTFRQANILYRCLEIVYDTLLLCYCLYLSERKMSRLMIGIICVYCIEIITFITVFMAVIRDTFDCNRLQFNRSHRIYEEPKQSSSVSSFREKVS